MEKKGLGKGLGALIPGAEREETSSASEIDISIIALNPYQPRETFDDVKFFSRLLLDQSLEVNMNLLQASEG